MRTLRTAVIGLGSMGKNHVRHYSEMEGIELVAIADPDREVHTWFRQRYHARRYFDYREMLDHEKLDMVSVTVPTVSHCEVALQAIDRGLHLIVEKPIALTEDQGMQIIERAHEKHVKLTIGHVERFNPVVTRLKQEIRKGTLGKVFRIHAKRQSPYPFRIQDVGVVIDLAPHDIDVMRYLLDAEIGQIYAEVASHVDERRDDLLSCMLKFRNGILGILEVDWLTPTTVRELAISGEKGMFVANYLTQELFFYENEVMMADWDSSRQFVAVSEGEMRKLKIHRKEPLRLELEDFARAVREDRQPRVSGEDGLQALRIARAILESGRRKQIVHLPAPGTTTSALNQNIEHGMCYEIG